MLFLQDAGVTDNTVNFTNEMWSGEKKILNDCDRRSLKGHETFNLSAQVYLEMFLKNAV